MRNTLYYDFFLDFSFEVSAKKIPMIKQGKIIDENPMLTKGTLNPVKGIILQLPKYVTSVCIKYAVE